MPIDGSESRSRRLALKIAWADDDDDEKLGSLLLKQIISSLQRDLAIPQLPLAMAPSLASSSSSSTLCRSLHRLAVSSRQSTLASNPSTSSQRLPAAFSTSSRIREQSRGPLYRASTPPQQTADASTNSEAPTSDATTIVEPGSPSSASTTKSNPAAFDLGPIPENVASVQPPLTQVPLADPPSSKKRKSKKSKEFVNPILNPTAPIDFSNIHSFPSMLHHAHPILDSGRFIEVEPTDQAPWGATATFLNDEKMYPKMKPTAGDMVMSGLDSSGSGEATDEMIISQVTPMTAAQLSALHKHVLEIKRVSKQTGKGKIQAVKVLVVVGNGRGLVGFGQGKDENGPGATRKAFQQAVKNMDHVQRFENRTVWKTMVGDWAATQVHLRPRPPGENRNPGRDHAR